MTRDEIQLEQPAILGTTCRVEMCACGRALVLSLGPVSVRLDVAAAEDVATTLAFAIQRCALRPAVPEPPLPEQN